MTLNHKCGISIKMWYSFILFFSQNALLYGLWYCSSVLRLSCNTRHSLRTRVALFLERQSDPLFPILYYPSWAFWDNRKGSTSLQATSSSTEWSRQNGLTKPYHQFKTSQSMLYPSGPQPVAYQLLHDYNSQHAGSCSFCSSCRDYPIETNRRSLFWKFRVARATITKKVVAMVTAHCCTLHSIMQYRISFTKTLPPPSILRS